MPESLPTWKRKACADLGCIPNHVVEYRTVSARAGNWKPTEEQPESKGRNKFVWEIEYPKLLHVYKFEYSGMVTP